MKKIILYAFLTCVAVQLLNAQTPNEKNTPVLRHVVLFKFADKATPAEVKKIEEAFRSLKTKIALIKDFEWGTNNSPEKLNNGLTHCFLVTFSSEKDRDAYLIHPDHKAFVAIAGSNIEKATVLDYWAHK